MSPSVAPCSDSAATPDVTRAEELVARATTRPARPSDEVWVDIAVEMAKRQADAAAIRALTDANLRHAYGNVVADFTLAERYEHNAPLLLGIRARLDQLVDEMARRWLAQFHAAGVPKAPSQEDISGDIARGKTQP